MSVRYCLKCKEMSLIFTDDALSQIKETVFLERHSKHATVIVREQNLDEFLQTFFEVNKNVRRVG